MPDDVENYGKLLFLAYVILVFDRCYLFENYLQFIELVELVVLSILD